MFKIAAAGCLFLIVLCAAGVVSPPSGAQSGAPRPVAACGDAGQIFQASKLPRVIEPGRCAFADLTLTDHGAKTEVPPPGTGVSAEVLTNAGPQELTVVHRAGGAVVLSHVGDDSKAVSGSAQGGPTLQQKPNTLQAQTSPSACHDDAYVLEGWRVRGELGWHYRRNSTPAHLTTATAVRAIRAGAANITSLRNSCHLSGTAAGATMPYQGITSLRTDESSSGACLQSDSKSVTEFGRLPDQVLGVTCVWFRVAQGASGVAPDTVLSSDLRLNDAHGIQWTGHVRRGCANRYSLEAVATHERGHTFGLGHASPEGKHRYLTMSPQINGTCQNSESTLGLGDVRGLERIYGSS